MKNITFLLIFVLNLSLLNAQEPFSDEWYNQDFGESTGAWESFDYPKGFFNRDFPQTAWTGEEYLIWHGCNNETQASDWKGIAVDGKYIPNNGMYFTDGWIINPQTQEFRKMAKSYLPPLVEGYNSVWTGTHLFTWGYTSSRCKLYNYKTNKWTKVSTASAPSTRINVNFLWTGSEIFVYGGDHPQTGVLTENSYMYNPTTNRWRKLPYTGLLGKRSGCVTFWTGEEAIVWGGNGDEYYNNGAAYNPETNTWRKIADNPYGTGWNWNVFPSKNGFVLTSADERKICFYDIEDDSWTAEEFRLQSMSEKTEAWTDFGFILWAGGSNRGLIFDKETYEWQALPMRFGSPESGDTEGIWTGEKLFVLNNDKAYLYNPNEYYEAPSLDTQVGRFTDYREDRNYKTITINGTTWMAENLIFDPNSGKSFCLDDDNTNCETYGRLYDWQTSKQVCPSGWHLPSEQDWKDLIEYAGGEDFAPTSLLSQNAVENATNSSGFSLELAGCRNEFDYYDALGQNTFFWSSTQVNYFDDRVSGTAVSVYKSKIFTHMHETNAAGYVRCVKD